jgi:hypothetical protein
MVLLEDIARESTVYIQGCGLVVHGSAGLFERFGASHFRQRHRALYRNSKTNLCRVRLGSELDIRAASVDSLEDVQADWMRLV